ncbi:MAG: invasion associated locus B family protein [Bauldia sp.]
MILKGRTGLGLGAALVALGALASANAFAQGATTAPGKAPAPAAGAAGKTTTPPLIAPPAAAAPAGAAAAGQSNWSKICGEDPLTKKGICIVRYDIRTDQGQLIAQVTIQKNEALDKPPYGVGVMLPIGAYLPPGVSLTVDGKGKAIKADYQICLPQVCMAEAGADAAAFDTIRKGTKLVMVAKNAQQKDMTFELSLAGFAKVFDGPGIDQAAAKAQDDALTQALAARAEQARQQLIQKQQNPGAP